MYVAKLEELKKVVSTIYDFLHSTASSVSDRWLVFVQQGDPIEMRFKEYSNRESVINQLAFCINNYRDAAVSTDPKFDHIDLAEKQKVYNKCFHLSVPNEVKNKSLCLCVFLHGFDAGPE